jgi:hypothetical protein
VNRTIVDRVSLLSPGARLASLCASTMASVVRAASPRSCEFCMHTRTLKVSPASRFLLPKEGRTRIERVRLCAMGEERDAGVLGADRTLGEGSGTPGDD